MRCVVDAAELTPDDFVLEVGTGTGSLTRMAADLAGEVLTVELDPELASVAGDVLHGLANVSLIHADVLAGKHSLNPGVLRRLEDAATRWSHVKLAANLPYSVATPVIANLLFQPVTFERMVFTVQREVAERMIAAPGTKAYGWLSALVAVAGKVLILRQLPATAFWPRPEVASSLVILRLRKGWKKGLDLEAFRAFGAFVFQHRRKTVLRILREYMKRSSGKGEAARLLEAAGVDPKTRGDQLEPQELLCLSHSVQTIE
jgi:16S rRNA (adenine1518-N6/adenine1519-N6)-dimethyltransferase